MCTRNRMLCRWRFPIPKQWTHCTNPWFRLWPLFFCSSQTSRWTIFLLQPCQYLLRVWFWRSQVDIRRSNWNCLRDLLIAVTSKNTWISRCLDWLPWGIYGWGHPWYWSLWPEWENISTHWPSSLSTTRALPILWWPSGSSPWCPCKDCFWVLGCFIESAIIA